MHKIFLSKKKKKTLYKPKHISETKSKHFGILKEMSELMGSKF